MRQVLYGLRKRHIVVLGSTDIVESTSRIASNGLVVDRERQQACFQVNACVLLPEKHQDLVLHVRKVICTSVEIDYIFCNESSP